MDTEELSSDTFPEHFRAGAQPEATPKIDAAWDSIDPALREGVTLKVKGKTRNAFYNRFKARITMSHLFEEVSMEGIQGVLLHELGHHHSYLNRRPYLSSFTFNSLMRTCWAILSLLAFYNLLAFNSKLPELWWVGPVIFGGFLLDRLVIGLFVSRISKAEEFKADRFAAAHGSGYGFAHYLLTFTDKRHSLYQKIYGTHPGTQERYDRLMGLDKPVFFHGDPQRGSSFFLGNES